MIVVKNSDVLLRIDSLLSDLYETMQTEEWWNDSNVPDVEFRRFMIVNALVDSMTQYVYHNKGTKEDIKTFVCDMIDKNL